LISLAVQLNNLLDVGDTAIRANAKHEQPEVCKHVLGSDGVVHHTFDQLLSGLPWLAIFCLIVFTIVLECRKCWSVDGNQNLFLLDFLVFKSVTPATPASLFYLHTTLFYKEIE
jgi:hypothetical protein